MHFAKSCVLLGRTLAITRRTSKHIGRLVPEEVGGNAHRALNGSRHRVIRGFPLLAQKVPQIFHCHRLAIAAQDHAKAELFPAPPRSWNLATLGQAVIMAFQCLQNGHRTTSFAWKGGTSITPSTICARKKRDSLPRAK